MFSHQSYIKTLKTKRKSIQLQVFKFIKHQRVNMAKFEKLFTLSFFIIIPNIIQVDANFVKSMIIEWGAQNALLWDDNLQLTLDEITGEIKL